MTKLDIIKESSRLTGLTKVETELVLDSILSSIKSSLADGKRIDIDQFFGSYHLPSDEEVEDLIMELPEVRRYDMKIKPVWNFHR